MTNSSVSSGEEKLEDRRCVHVGRSEPHETEPPAKGSSSSRKRHHDPHAGSSSPDLRVGSSRTYVMRDSANNYRKVHHVWSQ
ncbi:hypothetical protein MTO96_001980 [Rhipicephalus appendiculatus]